MDFIICPLINFKCSNYKEPVEVKNNDSTLFYMLYNETELLNIPKSYKYAEIYGLQKILYLKDTIICYQRCEPSQNNTNKRKVLINNLFVACQIFSNALWFVRDNAITPYFSTISSDSAIEPNYLQRNIYYSNSKSGYDLTEFSIEEIEEAMKWYEILDKLVLKAPSETVNVSDKLTNMSNYLRFDVPSFQRAFYYLNVARTIDFLPAKIASYISILESLLAVKGDNTHKVAERIAYLLGVNAEDRIQIYNDIHDIYNIRSLYVHGSEIKSNTFEILPDSSYKIDCIVRKVLIEMFLNHKDLNYKNKKDKQNSDAKNFEDVDEWFNNLMLGKE